VSVIDNPANDLLELDTGHLVPVTFVDRRRHPRRRPVITEASTPCPTALFDLLD
jgi:hypothetical protein